MSTLRHKTCSGFSLIEMVVAITVLGILSTSAAVFLRGPITSYFDAERRADLSDVGGLAMAKLTQDVSRAMPDILIPMPSNINNVTVVGVSGFPFVIIPRTNPLTPVTYNCNLATGELQRTAGAAPGNLLATNLVDCQVRRFPAAGAPAQWVALVLSFDDAGDRLTLYHTIRVDLP